VSLPLKLAALDIGIQITVYLANKKRKKEKTETLAHWAGQPRIVRRDVALTVGTGLLNQTKKKEGEGVPGERKQSDLREDPTVPST
jgi:hypothetical protein